MVLVFGLSLDSHFVSACSSNFAPGGGTNISRFDTSTAPKEVPITVALGTNVCDVFVFVLAHVLVSLVAKSLRQDLSHAAQASKMNDCSGLVKLSGGIASHICFRFQNLQCFVESTPSKNFTEANRLPSTISRPKQLQRRNRSRKRTGKDSDCIEYNSRVQPYYFWGWNQNECLLMLWGLTLFPPQ